MTKHTFCRPLPISELSDEDLRRQREEGLEHVPKIIPLEPTDVVDEPQTQIGSGALLNQEEPMEEVQQEPKPVFEEKMEEVCIYFNENTLINELTVY